MEITAIRCLSRFKIGRSLKILQEYSERYHLRIVSREFTAFLVHQVIGTLGVIMGTAMSWYTFLDLLKLGRIDLTTETAMFPLLGIPGFPFQGASGFVLGFTLARRLRARSIVFVWILPLLWFGLGALVVAPNSELGYLIGGSCKADRGCFYQLGFTLPLIASVGYTVVVAT